MTAVKAIEGCDELTPNIRILLQLFATLPVTTCTPERTFSVMHRVLTYLRSTMSENRLNGLGLMHVYKDMDLDVETIIDMFAGLKPRRMCLTDWSAD